MTKQYFCHAENSSKKKIGNKGLMTLRRFTNLFNYMEDLFFYKNLFFRSFNVFGPMERSDKEQ